MTKDGLENRQNNKHPLINLHINKLREKQQTNPRNLNIIHTQKKANCEIDLTITLFINLP